MSDNIIVMYFSFVSQAGAGMIWSFDANFGSRIYLLPFSFFGNETPLRDADPGKVVIMKQDYVDLFALFGIHVTEEGSSEEENVHMEDYLKKEEKILSLLREKKTRTFQASSVMDAIGAKKLEKALQAGDDGVMLYLISALSKLAAQKLQEGDNAFRKLFSSFPDAITINPLTSPNDRMMLNGVKKVSKRLRRRELDKTEPSEIGISMVLPMKNRRGTDVDESHLLVDPHGDIRSVHNGAGSKIRGSKESFQYCCNPDVFSIMILIAYMREYVQRELEEYGQDSILFQKLQALQEIVFSCNREKNNGILCVHEDACRSYILKYLKDREIPFLRKNEEDHAYLLQETDFLPALLLEKELNREDIVFSIVIGYFFSNGTVKSRRFLSLGGILWTAENSHVVTEVVKELTDVYQTQKQAAEYDERLRKDYAAVWETKKNIPQKVLRAMAESSFNDTFGYVEIDESCDLDKIEELEKEWKAIVGTLGLGEFKDTALRFRKLGNHKAAGLYFPFLHCLCVDVRYPSSMVHEAFHMMDYHRGKLSERYSFYGIRRRYEECLRTSIEQLPKEDSFRTRMEGKTKYNLAYYLTPTEIFARCGEMYMVRILNVDNSLVKPEKGLEYPEDEQLDSMIAAYFNAMFSERRDVA